MTAPLPSIVFVKMRLQGGISVGTLPDVFAAPIKAVLPHLFGPVVPVLPDASLAVEEMSVVTGGDNRSASMEVWAAHSNVKFGCIGMVDIAFVDSCANVSDVLRAKCKIQMLRMIFNLCADPNGALLWRTMKKLSWGRILVH